MMVLAAEALTIGYGGKPVASGISLDLEPGTITCLLGPNGVGKTTLFKTLLGLIPPLRGTVRIGGRDLAELTRETVARHVAYVPQAYKSDFAYTVLDLVVMGRTAYLGAFAAPRQADYAIAIKALSSLGLASLADRDANRISGGQHQLALIARALAQRAGAIVMDEPTASLDLANRLMVLDRIAALAKEGLAILISTHEPEQAFAIADSVAILGHGEHFVTGPVAEVLTAEQLSRLYGIPLSVERTPSGRLVVGPNISGAGDLPIAGK
jgi:iron complex transport system ATP-binding protein